MHDQSAADISCRCWGLPAQYHREPRAPVAPKANKHGQCNIPEIPSNLDYVQARSTCIGVGGLKAGLCSSAHHCG
jgi:hypothetical protein